MSPMLESSAAFLGMLALRAKDKQVRASAAIIRRFVWTAGISEPGQITAEAVAAYLGEMKRAGRSPKTLHNHATALRTFCDFLVRVRHVLAANPCADVRLPDLEERPPVWLSQGELAVALDVARANDIVGELIIPLATGLRRGEMTRLLWADVDVARRTLLVCKSKGRRPRSVPLSDLAVEAFELQHRKTGGFRFVFPGRTCRRDGGDWVDRPRGQNTWRRLFLPIQEALPKLQGLVGTGRMYHTLRHTFASLAAQGNVNLYKLARWMGHRDIRTTEIYAHLRDGYDRDIERGSALAPGVLSGRRRECSDE